MRHTLNRLILWPSSSFLSAIRPPQRKVVCRRTRTSTNFKTFQALRYFYCTCLLLKNLPNKRVRAFGADKTVVACRLVNIFVDQRSTRQMGKDDIKDWIASSGPFWQRRRRRRAGKILGGCAQRLASFCAIGADDNAFKTVQKDGRHLLRNIFYLCASLVRTERHIVLFLHDLPKMQRSAKQNYSTSLDF